MLHITSLFLAIHRCTKKYIIDVWKTMNSRVEMQHFSDGACFLTRTGSWCTHCSTLTIAVSRKRRRKSLLAEPACPGYTTSPCFVCQQMNYQDGPNRWQYPHGLRSIVVSVGWLLPQAIDYFLYHEAEYFINCEYQLPQSVSINQEDEPEIIMMITLRGCRHFFIH